jgi:hypothetical protein
MPRLVYEFTHGSDAPSGRYVLFLGDGTAYMVGHFRKIETEWQPSTPGRATRRVFVCTVGRQFRVDLEDGADHSLDPSALIRQLDEAGAFRDQASGV